MSNAGIVIRFRERMQEIASGFSGMVSRPTGTRSRAIPSGWLRWTRLAISGSRRTTGPRLTDRMCLLNSRKRKSWMAVGRALSPLDWRTYCRKRRQERAGTTMMAHKRCESQTSTEPILMILAGGFSRETGSRRMATWTVNNCSTSLKRATAGFRLILWL